MGQHGQPEQDLPGTLRMEPGRHWADAGARRVVRLDRSGPRSWLIFGGSPLEVGTQVDHAAVRRWPVVSHACTLAAFELARGRGQGASSKGQDPERGDMGVEAFRGGHGQHESTEPAGPSRGQDPAEEPETMSGTKTKSAVTADARREAREEAAANDRQLRELADSMRDDETG